MSMWIEWVQDEGDDEDEDKDEDEYEDEEWDVGGIWLHMIARLADLVRKCFPCYTLVSTRGGHKADFGAQ